MWDSNIADLTPQDVFDLATVPKRILFPDYIDKNGVPKKNKGNHDIKTLHEAWCVAMFSDAQRLNEAYISPGCRNDFGDDVDIVLKSEGRTYNIQVVEAVEERESTLFNMQPFFPWTHEEILILRALNKKTFNKHGGPKYHKPEALCLLIYSNPLGGIFRADDYIDLTAIKEKARFSRFDTVWLMTAASAYADTQFMVHQLTD